MNSKVALVTGGTGTIGSEICRQLFAAGFKAAATCHPSEAGGIEEWRARLRAEGCEVMAVPADLADFDAAKQVVAEVEGKLGSIEILVNAAGITRDASLRKMSHQQWREVMGSNLDSVFNVSRALIEDMIGRGYGRIVNISSVNGQKGQVGQTNYSAAKAGMHGFTMALAREVAGKGITVNTVSPGYIETPMIMQVKEDVRAQILTQIPVGRFGQPAEIARVVAFLVAEESGFITGADISVNGGQHMS